MDATAGSDLRRGYDLRLEALRGVAALTVAALHAGSVAISVLDVRSYLLEGGGADSSGWAFASQLSSLLLNGQGAVVLFFVLSGYVLRLSLDRATGPAGQLAFRFLGRRLLRLLPPVAVMAVIFVAGYWLAGLSLAPPTPGLYSLPSTVRHALLLDNRIDPVVWTLQIEVLAAPVVLLVWFAARRFGQLALWVAAFAGLAASFSPGLDRSAAAALGFNFPPFSFLYAFVAGMIIVEWSRFALRSGITKLGGVYPLFCALMIMAAPAVAAGGWRVALEVLGAAGLVTGVALNLRGIVTWLLDRQLMRFYGRISYSFYLYHPLAVALLYLDPTVANALAAAGAPAVVSVLGIFIFTTVIVTPLAAASYWLVELPAMRLGRRLGSRRPLVGAEGAVPA